MTDRELVAAFEAGTLGSEEFRHREHVRLAWLYLSRHDVLDAVRRLASGLRRLAAARGAPNAYHETITWAYVFLTHERRTRLPGDHTWDEFERANPDLFEGGVGLLRRYYSRETLGSDLARRVFVLPDAAGATEGS